MTITGRGMPTVTMETKNQMPKIVNLHKEVGGANANGTFG